ncbi:helix-turn-helix domain-containing protein [Streptomyces triculaminicus]|uniref:Helix-turn-helix domain-containing protein n=1 Tax=Streptomyces triculaminicus TaxID=2816232 RepID=A0A939JP47_9ACTN|nr:XRE family transcriptional regulator [Streptomyces triculaminicus]MBO0656006.1 helix-turn-helix domain-containing protein [Streptomyces triculaminicus]
MLDGDQWFSFGLLLRRYRLTAGMTQEELAEASGLSVRAISDLERGRTGRPRRKSVELLTEALAQGDDATWRLVEAARAARLAPDVASAPAAYEPTRDARDHGEPAGHRLACELPPDTVDFTAREAELRRITEALALGDARPGGPERPERRLTLVAGHPGAGKTALAVHAAHRSLSRFPDGQLYVELSPAGRPALRPAEVVRRILRSLGALDDGLGSLEEASARLRAVLARRKVLVLLDDAVSEGQIRCAHPAVGESAVIATCRRRLSALAGAESVTVGAFGPEESLAFLARMLGEERVRAARSDAALVAELCGHLPLALRVIGCRLLARPHWTMRTLIDEVLDDPRTRLRELSSGDVTVRAAIAAAFSVLDDQAQWALYRLAQARAPGFSLRGAAVALDCGIARAHRLVGDLLDGHLVEVLDERLPGDPRYLIPPVVRLFAAEGARNTEGGTGPRAPGRPAQGEAPCAEFPRAEQVAS